MASVPSGIPTVPAKHNDFISHLVAHPNTPMREIIEPYKQYDSRIRQLFAQEPDHPELADPHLNITPVFAGHQADLKLRARNLAAESEEEKEKYLMPLDDEKRKPNGTPAVVQSLKEFQTNFNVFSESSLVDMDWSNVVAAGSSVVTPLLPVPGKYAGSKRALRQYYHEIVAPASDVDLFIYGLSEEEAIEKIKQIEANVKDAILQETTTIRTKHAITIASQYPTRHVQIVLRIYKSVAEILTGFDVDCSCAAYDGKQVYASPRALSAYITQVNTIDLTRRSPSYENRLSKYSHRGFEIYWPQLDRTRIDPTIFERNFARTLGLARLLVLEKLPASDDRDAYMDQRRRERGRPAIDRYSRYARTLQGNIKEKYEDEVAEWVEEDEVADYHTFTIPYGQHFHARKIEKLLYTKDLLLNAEWNEPKDREVNLHRHPAFFGNAEDVIHDCCGYCPKPKTPEEEEVAKEESKIYVSGQISFIRDDPGRQSIGSFNPLTDNDWTEMAYVGNTARLCQAIIDGDLEHVQDWLAQEGSDPNSRDFTGRTPLHLACLSSTPEIVQCLVDAGARMVARLADGRTALHLAAARGDVDMVKILMKKSEGNEEEEARKDDLRKQARLAAKKYNQDEKVSKHTDDADTALDEEDAEMVDAEDSDEDVEMKSATTSSFVNVKKGEEKNEGDNLPDDEDEDEPDVYDINVLAWDTPCSPLHLAIVNGHFEVVKELVQNFGADVLLPVKLLEDYDKSPRAAILTLVLSLRLPLEEAQKMTRVLLDLGASSAQADMHQITALHRFTTQKTELLQTLLDHDLPGAQRAVNHLAVDRNSWSPTVNNPLLAAIEKINPLMAMKLLTLGAKPEIDFQKFMDALLVQHGRYANQDTETNKQTFRKNVEQPILLAVKKEMPDLVLKLLQLGAEPNTLTSVGWSVVDNYSWRRNHNGQSLLDLVRGKLEELRNYEGENVDISPPKPDFEGDGEEYIGAFEDGSYKQWIAVKAVQGSIKRHKQEIKAHEERIKESNKSKGLEEKKRAVDQLIKEFEKVERELIAKGAKAFNELYPDLDKLPEKEPDYVVKNEKEKPWEVKFNFLAPDLTDKKKEGYLSLYESAWKGDLLTIKRLTLTFWGELRDQFPLKIAIKDGDGYSPFHIALFRGHTETAKGILEISQAQYKPNEGKVKERYTMGHAPEDDYDDESSQASEASEDEDQIKVFREIVDDQFTIENIGEVATQVRSRTSPLNFFNMTCNVPQLKGDETNSRYTAESKSVVGLFSHPKAGEWQYSGANSHFQFALHHDDLNLLKSLLQWGAEYTALCSNSDDDQAAQFYNFGSDNFDYAMRHGRTRCLAEIIKQTGASIPLEHLVKKSGVEIKEVPKYYQGLSIHGKKRADWATAGRDMRAGNVENKHPPLLAAAREGSLDSVEWFLSDAPARCYSEFAEKNKADKRLKNLEKASGGFDKAILRWLDTRHDLVIHCVVMSNTEADTTQLLAYLIRTTPKSLETKSSSTGQTPLHLAFSLGRFSAAKQLIAAGADQTCRDSTGNNLIHAVLCSNRGYNDNKYTQLFKMLELVDTRLRQSLFTERSSVGVGGVTPLSRWLSDYAVDTDECAAALRHLLSLSLTCEELEMVNGAGDTPLHILVKQQKLGLMRVILDERPELLYRENTTGRTPAEMAWDMWIAECFQGPPALPRIPCEYYYYNYNNSGSQAPIVLRDAKSFLPKKEGEADDEERSMTKKMWDLCQERMAKHKASCGEKRKLVSLSEANEVAKRLAKRQKSERGRRRRDEDDGEVEGEENESAGDEVAVWCVQG